MDTLRAMQVFVEVVESGSFASAAQHLDMSAVMVGKYVKGLEDSLGAPLLLRTTRRQQLTEVGEAYLEQVYAVLAGVRRAERVVESRRDRPLARLRISSAVTLGECVLAPELARFCQEHEGVSVELELDDNVVDLRQSQIQLALRVGEPAADLELVAHGVGLYQMVICAAPAYLERRGMPFSLNELQAHQCLWHQVWSARSAWQLQGPDGPVSWPARRGFAANKGEALRRAAVAGAGLLMQPKVLLQDDLDAGRLVPLLEAFTPRARPVYLLHAPELRRMPALGLLLRHLRRHLPAQLR